MRPIEFNRLVDAIEALARAGEDSDHLALEELKSDVRIAYQILYDQVGQLSREIDTQHLPDEDFPVEDDETFKDDDSWPQSSLDLAS